MIYKLLPSILISIVVGIALNAIMVWFLSTNPQPEIVWLIIATIIPILGTFLTFITILWFSGKGED